MAITTRSDAQMENFSPTFRGPFNLITHSNIETHGPAYYTSEQLFNTGSRNQHYTAQAKQYCSCGAMMYTAVSWDGIPDIPLLNQRLMYTELKKFAEDHVALNPECFMVKMNA